MKIRTKFLKVLEILKYKCPMNPMRSRRECLKGIGFKSLWRLSRKALDA